MHLLFTPNHVQLLNSCYPPSSALLTAAPNSQELSRLTYYASNHPGKLSKLGSELEKRLRVECRKARAGNVRNRASLLITLSIFRSLATECRRDIALLSSSLVASVDAVLLALPSDLELVARAASVFTAWTTYTDGHLIGTDSNMTRDYLSALEKFSELSCSNVADHEVRNRTRLIGFAALSGAVNSEALFNDATQFRAQVSIIMRPVLLTVLQTEISTLDEQAVAVKEDPVSPYLAEFRTRPAMERRAASIHVHIDGDKGPTMEDVSNACLHALFSLLEHAHGAQLGYIMHSSFDSLDKSKGWTSLAHCCWFAQKAAEWSQYQYRYAVPTWLVERLLDNQQTPTATPLLGALASMITTVFNSPTPLVNLSTSDVISNLITLLLRRTVIDADDTLLPALVECIASLGRHVYYSDQVQDLSGELISRLVVIEVQGISDRGKPASPQSRSQAVRCLIAGLLGLIRAVDKTGTGKETEESIKKTGTVPSESSPIETIKKGVGTDKDTSRRTRVSPDIWQDTLSLLCDNDYAVRADYAEALIFYLVNELPKRGDTTDADGIKRVRPLVEGPLQQATNMNVLLRAGDVGTKFLNAVHSYVYILSTTSSLGFTSSPSTSPAHSMYGDIPLNVLPATPISDNQQEAVISGAPEPSPLQTSARRSFSIPQGPQTRKSSVVQRLLDRTPSRVSPSSSACLGDYKHILDVLTTVHEQLPIRALLTGVPMILALDAATRIEDAVDAATVQRIETIREVVARVWLVVGTVWSSQALVEIAESALSSLPESSNLPPVPQSEVGSYHPPRVPVNFTSTDAKAQNAPWTGVNAEAALLAIVSTQSVQDATGLDKQGLLRRFNSKWTADTALRDPIDKLASADATARGDGVSPLLKISPALMHIENISLQSLARSTKGVGVTDLREALEGRSSLSNPTLARPPSISTLDHATSVIGGDANRLTQTRSRPRTPRTKKRAVPSGSGEVRDVLNRLGIGKQNGSLLKASFPTVQKDEQQSVP